MESSNVEVKLCMTCQGEGEVSYEYNHRILKRVCDKCKGDGTFTYKQGVLQVIEEPEATVPRLSVQDGFMTPKQKCVSAPVSPCL